MACLCSASLVVLATSIPASADVVWATKDCTGGTCMVTTGGNPTPALAAGRFRVIGPGIQWQALYQGTPQRFWVAQGGMNMADVQLTAFNGELGGNFNLPLGLWYISARTANMGPGSYTVSGPNVKGDPHITTMNGRHYDFQGAGEFVLLKNDDSGFEVQSRMTPVSTVGPLPPDPHTGISACPSINTAAAVKSPGHRFSYQPASVGNARSPQMQLRIDGKRASVRPQGMTLNDGTRINLSRVSGELRITLRDGWGVRIIPTWWSATGLWYLDFDFTPATSAMGIAGPIAKDSWLPALSDGSSVGPIPGGLPQRHKILYEKFADSWRVSGATSLFHYQAGTSGVNFTNAEWPRQGGNCRLPNTNPLAQMSEARATKICGGVHVPQFRKACIADVMATGDKVFAAGYVKLQGPIRMKTQIRDARKY
ncbi:MAG: hypothetical protein H0W65_01835 [Sphingomonas sp.]|nr:hypothetical protein [Sphingomonas sp.]